MTRRTSREAASGGAGIGMSRFAGSVLVQDLEQHGLHVPQQRSVTGAASPAFFHYEPAVIVKDGQPFRARSCREVGKERRA